MWKILRNALDRLRGEPARQRALASPYAPAVLDALRAQPSLRVRPRRDFVLGGIPCAAGEWTTLPGAYTVQAWLLGWLGELNIPPLPPTSPPRRVTVEDDEVREALAAEGAWFPPVPDVNGLRFEAPRLEPIWQWLPRRHQ